MDNYRNPKAVLIDTCQRLDLFKWNRLFLLIIFLCSTHMYNSLLYINGKRFRSIARPVPVEIQLYLQWQPQLFTHCLGARSVEWPFRFTSIRPLLASLPPTNRNFTESENRVLQKLLITHSTQFSKYVYLKRSYSLLISLVLTIDFR